LRFSGESIICHELLTKRKSGIPWNEVPIEKIQKQIQKDQNALLIKRLKGQKGQIGIYPNIIIRKRNTIECLIR
jgi:hypothetical protein